jgi:hypothetical protein
MRQVIKEALQTSAAVVLLAALGGCTRGPSMDARPDTGGGPVVARLDPASGPAGEDYPIALTIHGSGFAATGNMVHFGSVPVPDLPSTAGGTRITLSVPKVVPSTGEVAPFVLMPGDYPVTVTTNRGTSEPVTFRLTRQPEGASR